LSHVIDTSHTTPTTHVNRTPMLLKLIGDIVHALDGFYTYPKPWPQFPETELGLPLGTQ